jgi:hypothetical protein
MKRYACALALLASLLLVAATPSAAGLVDFAVGAYGGANVQLQGDNSAGSVVGAKVRILPPVPIIGVEAWYSHFTYKNPDEIAQSGDLSLALDGEGFDLYGADVLIGGVRGVPGFKWYGIVGVSAPKFEEIVDNVKKDTRKLGGQVGVGLEIVVPAVGLGVEGRAELMFLDLSGDTDDKMALFTLGANYYF